MQISSFNMRFFVCGLNNFGHYVDRVNPHLSLVWKVHHDQIIPNYKDNKDCH